ncbi:MAG TPA: AI-2E family transporter [Anaerolineales bacterium]|jgi:predicted PurR-regulated permease PerM|nr:AI-2E family transporter [Anaerolineales bacterium]
MAVNSLPQPYNWTFRRVVWATLVLLSVILGFWLLYRFNQAIFTLFIAIVIGTVIRPAVAWLHRRGLPQTLGVILVYLLLLLLLIGFLLLLFPLLSEQGTTIATAMPVYYQDLRQWVVSHPNQFLASLSEFLPAALPKLGPVQQTQQELVDSAGQVAGYVTSLSKGIFTAIMILALAFYWTLDGPRIIQSFLLVIPQSQRESIGELIAAMESKVGFYIVGQAILCAVIGIMALIAYLLIGLPNALVLALIAGVLEAVPMIGPLLGAVPAALVALSIAPGKLIWVVVATVVIQQVENSLLVPRIMKKAVGVNPFVTLLALFAFSTLFGLAGALMAIPMAAMIQLALNHFVFKQETVEMEVSEGRDFASRLRYEAQDLAQDLRKQARLQKRGSDQTIGQVEQVMDEIETITTSLDALLAKANQADAE